MKMIIANWKMNVGVRESVALSRGVLLALRGRKIVPELVVCPSFVALSEVRKVVAHSAVGLGAQDVFWEDVGSYTGEISPRMLLELGVSTVIIGHSERRRQLGETNEMIKRKVATSLKNGLKPIVCVGETIEERSDGRAQDVVREQLVSALADVRVCLSDKVLVAYEPVWAIGTGKSAGVQDAVLMHTFIREILRELHPKANASQFKILYGGSVDGEKAYGFLREDEIDGVLVSSASIKIKQFYEIVRSACEVLEGSQIKKI